MNLCSVKNIKMSAMIVKKDKRQIVVPVCKSLDTTDINNCRPISILSVMSKVSEKSVAEKLTEHLNSSPFTLQPMQFGFRAKHSTETANCFFQAFNTVNHQILRVSGETSPPLRNELGVPQGYVLGPILFSLYINDLPSVCTGCEVQMYADDTVIYVYAQTKAEAAA